jgi:hypothetical protein
LVLTDTSIKESIHQPTPPSSRFAEICHVSLGPAADTSYLKSRRSIANAGSFEMHPAIEAM